MDKRFKEVEIHKYLKLLMNSNQLVKLTRFLRDEGYANGATLEDAVDKTIQLLSERKSDNRIRYEVIRDELLSRLPWKRKSKKN